MKLLKDLFRKILDQNTCKDPKWISYIQSLCMAVRYGCEEAAIGNRYKHPLIWFLRSVLWVTVMSKMGSKDIQEHVETGNSTTTATDPLMYTMRGVKTWLGWCRKKWNSSVSTRTGIAMVVAAQASDNTATTRLKLVQQNPQDYWHQIPHSTIRALKLVITE